MHLSPHWYPKNPSGVQSILCVHVSFSLSLFLLVLSCLFLEIICAAYNRVQCMRLQDTDSNPLSGSIICMSVRMSIRLVVHPSVHPFIRGPFAILYFYEFPVWGSSVTMNLSPHWVLKYPSGFQLSLYLHLSISLSVRFYVSLSGLLSHCLAIKACGP